MVSVTAELVTLTARAFVVQTTVAPEAQSVPVELVEMQYSYRFNPEPVSVDAAQFPEIDVVDRL